MNDSTPARARPPRQSRTGLTSTGARKAASKSARSRAREFALQALYQHLVGRNEASAIDSFTRDLAGFHKADAALISKIHDRELRRVWAQRIIDHDGREQEEGGIERWLVLTDGLGLPRDYVISREGALPATVFAVEAYVRFVAEQPPVVAVSSCLTELFAPAIHKERIVGMLENYDFIEDRVLAYFRRRLDQAPRDADFALDYVKRHALTIAEQQGVIDALLFKCNVLWAQLDALYAAYVAPGMVPPGAFRPEDWA